MRAMEPRSLRLPATHGLTLNALEWSSAGTLLLFLHGFSQRRARLGPGRAGVRARTTGCSRSTTAATATLTAIRKAATTTRPWRATLRAHWSHSASTRVVLVGHSLGGRVAMRFAGLFPEALAGLVIVDSAPELDARGTTRIRLDVQQQEPSFASREDYERILVRQYPATRPELLSKLAVHWTRQRPDGRFELKLDPAFMRGRRGMPEDDLARLSAEEAKHLWSALEKLPCPALVVRGAASDVLSADVADKMADEVLKQGKLEVIARAGHSVMLDNPEGFEKALSGFVLGD